MDGTGPNVVTDIPAHVAIIMDGNGRWARERGLPRTAGHRQGAEAVRRTVRAAAEMGIRYLTVFGFSAENWKRPLSEVDDLMWLLKRYLQSEIAELHRNNVRMRVIGERSRLAPDIVRLIEDAEATTAENDRLTFTIALNYGGRQEIVEASRRLAENVAAGRLAPKDIDATVFAQHLSAPDIPDPDLLIRTSGEKRISNFLLWQCSYSELVFIDRLWPDFSGEDLADAVREYQRRERRYGAAIGSR
ncbi:isoprenyl transferase [Ferruginivarius sediminum]|uniref:Isoprenyl transferase n=1 Tax=Ferruginivarius sediminum TaxID=2661937 RepID=A0A369TBA0_9PROT|nr:isoprenyl transferase [Ferruginivarius sediminum]RDD62132.1 isoprenyl transferase [Ferruginivarius sediminum]